MNVFTLLAAQPAEQKVSISSISFVMRKLQTAVSRFYDEEAINPTFKNIFEKT